MKLTYRQFRDSDARRCSAILMGNFHQKLRVEAGGYILETPKVRKQWGLDMEIKELILKKGEDHLRVAEDQMGNILGMIGFLDHGLNAELVDFFVQLQMHGEGIGKFLLENMISDLQRNGYDWVNAYSLLSAYKFL